MLEVKTAKKETLTRAYNMLTNQLCKKTKTSKKLYVKDFAKALAALETQLLKNCCLYNYYDTKQNEIIPNFTVSFSNNYDELSSNDFKQMVKKFEQLKFSNNEK